MKDAVSKFHSFCFKTFCLHGMSPTLESICSIFVLNYASLMFEIAHSLQELF